VTTANFDFAYQCHQQGALSQAEDSYKAILVEQPFHFQALHFLGVLYHQQGRSLEGLGLIKAALAFKSDCLASRYNDLGNVLVQMAELEDALDAFQLSVACVREDANVWNNLASVLHRLKRLAEAETAYQTALSYAPNSVPILNNLVNLLAESGRDEESSRFVCLSYIQAPLQDKPLKYLAVAYFRLGLLAEAAECYRNWLKLEPENVYAQLHLAACTGQNVPSRCPEEYLKLVFDEMAGFFDEKLVTTLAYSGPQLIAKLLSDFALPFKATLAVLDGGCGTGLIASVLSPYAQRLVGVDISNKMLAKARERNLYTELYEIELTRFLLNAESSFDLIVMADTLIYFGDLYEVFGLVRQKLRPAGIFAFTIELCVDAQSEGINYLITPSGRYCHSRAYIAKVLSKCDFKTLLIHEAVLRSEFGQPILGFGILASASN
jgi:predicted TPR repeat methyltransferase